MRTRRPLVFLSVACVAIACGSPAPLPIDGGDAGTVRRDGAIAGDGDVARDGASPTSDGGCGPCAPSDCCVAGACVTADQDGDGYRRSECADVGPADCDDRSMILAPFPPRALPWTPHGDIRVLSQLSVAATVEGCALAVYLIDDGFGTAEVARLVDSALSCTGGRTPGPIAPSSIGCGSGMLEAVSAVDVASRDDELLLGIAGTCSADSNTHVVLTDLDGETPERVDQVALSGAIDLAVLTGSVNASVAMRDGALAVRLVRGTGSTLLRMTSTGDWLQAGAETVLFADNSTLLFASQSSSTLREELGLDSRAALVDFGANQYGVLVHRGTGELAMVGPLTGANALDVVGPPTSPWATDATDALLDAVALDDTRFLVAGMGNLPGGIRVALGRRGTELSIEDAAQFAQPGDAAPLVDLAIAARDRGTRTDVFVAVIADRLYSAHFAICPETP